MGNQGKLIMLYLLYLAVAGFGGYSIYLDNPDLAVALPIILKWDILPLVVVMVITFFVIMLPELFNLILIGIIVVANISAAFLIGTENQYSGYAIGFYVIEAFCVLAWALQANNHAKVTNPGYSDSAGLFIGLIVLSVVAGVWSGFWLAGLGTFIGLSILGFGIKLLRKN